MHSLTPPLWNVSLFIQHFTPPSVVTHTKVTAKYASLNIQRHPCCLLYDWRGPWVIHSVCPWVNLDVSLTIYYFVHCTASVSVFPLPLRTHPLQNSCFATLTKQNNMVCVHCLLVEFGQGARTCGRSQGGHADVSGAQVWGTQGCGSTLCQVCVHGLECAPFFLSRVPSEKSTWGGTRGALSEFGLGM